MKQTIKKWLGIDRLEKIAEYNDDKKLNKKVEEAITSIFQGANKTIDNYYYNIKSEFEKCVAKEVSAQNAENKIICRKICEDAIAKRIDSEKFIDDIVERILRKQIKG